MEDGYQISKTRLDSLFKRLRNPDNLEFYNKYNEIIEEQEKLGVIERLSDISHAGNVCYIPHHGVFKKGSDKLRIVYDGSYQTSRNKVNINECLSPGPSLTNELIEMLMRFRTHDVVLTGDIQKAFLQIEVHEADRNYLRFLWYDHNGNLLVYRFARVPFGLTCSSFLLNATLRYHMELKCVEEGNSDLLKLLSKSHYVDDWLVGAKTPDEVLLIKKWLTEFLNTVGMKLHKFNSNSETVRQNVEADCPERDSVLGVPWDTRADEISFNIQKVLDNLAGEDTKRELYSLPAQIFDPLGFLQPFMFQAKLMFQEVCKAKIKWKGKLPSDIKDKFERWRKQIYKLAAIKLPQQVVLPNYDTVELHGFGDASQLGYCACIYMVSKNSSVNMSQLVVAKTRVAPLKEMTIPRLELTAAFLLARLLALVVKFHNHINFGRLVYYSDSMTALHWIHSDHKQWTVYVANRVRDINLLSCTDDWKYVKTDKNPADLGTRGFDADGLIGNDFWFHGPKFLVSGLDDETDDITPDITHPTTESLKEWRKMVNVVIGNIQALEQLHPCKGDGTPRSLSDYNSA